MLPSKLSRILPFLETTSIRVVRFTPGRESLPTRSRSKHRGGSKWPPDRLLLESCFALVDLEVNRRSWHLDLSLHQRQHLNRCPSQGLNPPPRRQQQHSQSLLLLLSPWPLRLLRFLRTAELAQRVLSRLLRRRHLRPHRRPRS